MQTQTIFQINESDLKAFLSEIANQIESSKEKEEHYTLKEVLAITKKSRSAVWNWERRGYLVPVRMGKTLLYLKSDLDAIMNKKRGGTV